MLPKDFPPWPTVYWWFRRFVRRFLFQTIHDVALMLDRERVGREAGPTGGVIDSQSVKAPEVKTRGYDAGKKIVGRKRHIAVDTDGRLLMVNLTTADISDSAGAQMILNASVPLNTATNNGIESRNTNGQAEPGRPQQEYEPHPQPEHVPGADRAEVLTPERIAFSSARPQSSRET
jgi:hypothetical protein